MLLYLIRHGETDWNKSRRLQGQTDIPLNDFGRHLALETAPALKDIPFDLAFTSPLSRAYETAELVLGDRNIPIIKDERIKEMCFGSYEGLKCKGPDMEIPDPEFDNFFHAPDKYHAPSDGESFLEFSDRLRNFLDDLLHNEDYKEKTILISTHGAALCGILRLIKGYGLSDFWGSGVHKNCALTKILVENGHIEILAENITYYKDKVKNW